VHHCWLAHHDSLAPDEPLFSENDMREGDYMPVVSESFLDGNHRDCLRGPTVRPIAYSSAGLQRVTMSGSVLVNGKFGRSVDVHIERRGEHFAGK